MLLYMLQLYLLLPKLGCADACMYQYMFSAKHGEILNILVIALPNTSNFG
jgi:hypothetical protein